VVGISERGVVIDFGYKSEGIVNPAEFTENGVLSVKPGDEVEVLVKSMETADGLPVLSRADAVRMKAWDDLEKAYRDGTNVKGRVIERIKGGLRVDIDGIAAFLPGSQVDVRPVRNLDSLRNRRLKLKSSSSIARDPMSSYRAKLYSRKQMQERKIKRSSTSKKTLW
jgi:small subunit ribosomal protein S1